MEASMINRSPRKSGCTSTTSNEIAKELHKQGIDSETMWIGTDGIHGYIDYGAYKGKHSYVLAEGIVNERVAKMKEADGLIVGSSVYYVLANGDAISLLDRTLYADDSHFVGKPVVAIASARRAGITAIIDEINKYFTISQMPMILSTYWDMMHGNCVEDVPKDEEGLQIMRNLARSMV